MRETKQIISNSESFILCYQNQNDGLSFVLDRVKPVIKKKTFPVKVTDFRPSLIKHMETWRIYIWSNSGLNLSKTVLEHEQNK